MFGVVLIGCHCPYPECPNWTLIRLSLECRQKVNTPELVARNRSTALLLIASNDLCRRLRLHPAMPTAIGDASSACDDRVSVRSTGTRDYQAGLCLAVWQNKSATSLESLGKL